MLRGTAATLLAFFALVATAGAEVRSGSVSDGREMPKTGALDVERVSVTYDSDLGRIDVEVRLYTPHAKTFNANLELLVRSDCSAERAGDLRLTNPVIHDVEGSGSATIVGPSETVFPVTETRVADPVFGFTYQHEALKGRGYVCVAPSSLETMTTGDTHQDKLKGFSLSAVPPPTTPAPAPPGPSSAPTPSPVAAGPPAAAASPLPPDRSAVLGAVERRPRVFVRRRQRAATVLAKGLAISVRCPGACRVLATLQLRGRQIGRGQGRLARPGLVRVVVRVGRRRTGRVVLGRTTLRVKVGDSVVLVPVRLG